MVFDFPVGNPEYILSLREFIYRHWPNLPPSFAPMITTNFLALMENETFPRALTVYLLPGYAKDLGDIATQGITHDRTSMYQAYLIRVW